MRSMLWLLVVCAAACVQSSSTTCGDRVCPGGTRCVELMESAGDPHRCVDPDAIPACSNVDARAVCTYAGLASPAACYPTISGSVCLPSGCSNGLVDQGEACDDGNAAVGDGCSASCTSNEQCGNGIVDPLKLMDDNLVLAETCDDGNFRGHDGCAGACDRIEAPRWASTDVTHPPARIDASMAFDPVRGHIVMYGGFLYPSTGCLTGPLGQAIADTWESADGVSWVNKTPTFGPDARLNTMLAYDGNTKRVILFGGSDAGTTQYRDMWSWDGETWVAMMPAALPSAREESSMAYDARNHKVVLFGGRGPVPGLDGTPDLADTWEWDGTTWTQKTTMTTPPARTRHTLAYDPVRGVIVMAGGDTFNGPAADTWEYDGTDWRLASPSGAPFLSAMAYDVTTAATIAYATTDGGSTWSTFSWNGSAWSSLGGTAPGNVAGAGLVTDPRGHALMFGGVINSTSGSVCNHAMKYDSWSWGGAQWTTTATPAPTARTLIAAAVDLARHRTVVVGGNDANQAVQNQTWEYDGATWTLFDGEPWPTGRATAAMAYDSAREQLVLFGGQDGAYNRYNDTYVRTGTTWAPRSQPGPLPLARVSPGMAYDAARARVMMFGGSNTGVDGLSDTWSWDGNAWIELHPAHSPPPRASFAMGYDFVTKRIVVFGGYDHFLLNRGDTWTWDGTDWTEQHPAASPLARSDTSMGWDPVRRRLVLVGGIVGSPRDDAWEWDGMAGTWNQLPPLEPRPQLWRHATVSALDGAGIETFGGFSVTTGDPIAIWRLRWKDTGVYETCSDQTDDDGDGLAGCADPDCWATCTPLCLPGELCDPGAAHCGDHVCSDTVENCRNCPDDCATCPMTFCGDTFCNGSETSGSCHGDCP